MKLKMKLNKVESVPEATVTASLREEGGERRVVAPVCVVDQFGFSKVAFLLSMRPDEALALADQLRKAAVA